MYQASKHFNWAYRNRGIYFYILLTTGKLNKQLKSLLFRRRIQIIDQPSEKSAVIHWYIDFYSTECCVWMKEIGIVGNQIRGVEWCSVSQWLSADEGEETRKGKQLGWLSVHHKCVTWLPLSISSICDDLKPQDKWKQEMSRGGPFRLLRATFS